MRHLGSKCHINDYVTPQSYDIFLDSQRCHIKEVRLYYHLTDTGARLYSAAQREGGVTASATSQATWQPPCTPPTRQTLRHFLFRPTWRLSIRWAPSPPAHPFPPTPGTQPPATQFSSLRETNPHPNASLCPKPTTSTVHSPPQIQIPVDDTHFFGAECRTGSPLLTTITAPKNKHHPPNLYIPYPKSIKCIYAVGLGIQWRFSV
jgi:hypothetical protein